MASKQRRLILLELNEINFDLVEAYIAAGEELPEFKAIIDDGLVTTSAEASYELLEPWIQWPSVHTGMEFSDHQTFRLGDFTLSEKEQFFETVERAGFVVGAISPMNAVNRLIAPAYFIPDPWTLTQSDKSFFGRHITAALRQAVNDNSQARLTMKSVARLLSAFIALVPPRRYLYFVKAAMRSRGKPWKKAILLDQFLHQVHLRYFKKKNPNFSVLFLNAGAHIQHHYLLSSSVVSGVGFENPEWYVSRFEDPYLDVLKSYDEILRDLRRINGAELIVATGLSQKPYGSPIFYYRLRNHRQFLKMLGLQFKDVAPRMTRDFLISFSSTEDAVFAQEVLSSLTAGDGIPLFGEIDNRGADLFVVLTYPYEIISDTMLCTGDRRIKLFNQVVFVAIKNGEHQSKGFAYLSPGLKRFVIPEGSHVSRLHNVVLDFFEAKV